MKVINGAFLVFFIRWVSSNLSIPFWVVGHIHLSVNIYHDLVEIISSFWLNFLVGLGFWFEWRDINRSKTIYGNKIRKIRHKSKLSIHKK